MPGQLAEHDSSHQSIVHCNPTIMKSWARKHDSCCNCGTNRFPHIGRGYCRRCYRLIRKRERVQNWIYEDRSTWDELPYSVREGFQGASEFERLRRGYVEQINERLALLGSWEDRRNGQLSALDLEYELRLLASEAGARNGWYLHSHYANWLRATFSSEQRQELYKLLNDIRQAKPWRGVDWYRIFRKD